MTVLAAMVKGLGKPNADPVLPTRCRCIGHAVGMAAYVESENASVSISMKMRPSVPTHL
jgi:hypothetical protein